MKTWLLLVFVVMGAGTKIHAQAPSSSGKHRAPTTQITEWQDDVSGALHFLHQLFSEANPESRIIILDNQDWSHSPAGIFWFTVYVCAPDSASLPEEHQREILTNYGVHCSTLTMYADFLMGGSQLGRVPVWILIGRPDQDKRWSELSVTLQAHPEWSQTQVQDAMRAARVKYGKDDSDEIARLIHKSAEKLEPFLGKLVIDSIEYLPPFLDLSSKELSPPVWRVAAYPSGQDEKKPRTTYVLIFNAFDGAFQSEQKFLR